MRTIVDANAADGSISGNKIWMFQINMSVFLYDRDELNVDRWICFLSEKYDFFHFIWLF